VVSPTGVLDLVDYSSSSDSDPSEDSLSPAPDLPLVSPFLCFDDSEADGESELAEQRPVSSSHDTLAPLLEFPLAPVVAPLGIRRRPVKATRGRGVHVGFYGTTTRVSGCGFTAGTARGRAVFDFGEKPPQQGAFGCA
ncbi:hypothetical protein Tco_0569868, partial [Tanacetum coccineum]